VLDEAIQCQLVLKQNRITLKKQIAILVEIRKFSYLLLFEIIKLVLLSFLKAT